MACRQEPHILYLEDDESALSITTLMLEHLGCHVRSETDSLNALRTFSEEPDAFNLAILETFMPQLSGLELAVRLRRILPRFPVLFCAGYTDGFFVHKVEAAGIGRVLFKPLAVNQLGGAIRQALMGGAQDAARRP
jgi:CheY-like chemotaxis protein